MNLHNNTFPLTFRRMRSSGIEPGSKPWQGFILPLNQERFLKNIQIKFTTSYDLFLILTSILGWDALNDPKNHLRWFKVASFAC